MTPAREKNIPWAQVFLTLIPVFGAMFVWLTPLAFVPVPWPDDSAFYFVAKELFKWPPRWVMLPQAPFEPTYKIFNFNTMPLYPILIGLGRWVGIDGSFLLKIWPLSAWALTGSFVSVALYRKGLSWINSALIALLFALDPELRWASVLVRPESLIGLAGAALTLGLTFGFPERFKPTRVWDPVAALLAIGAYSHFNAVHLLFPVVVALSTDPRRLFDVAWKTALYLVPWLLCVLMHMNLFVTQMSTQWTRLNVPNAWLKSVDSALKALFHDMGSPIVWHPVLEFAAMGMWILIFIAILFALFIPWTRTLVPLIDQYFQKRWGASQIHLAPAGSWLLGSIWLWHTKPEVWFMYYVHAALWCFTGILALKLTTEYKSKKIRLWNSMGLRGLAGFLIGILCIFSFVNLDQLDRLSQSDSWKWSTYQDFLQCIDDQLIKQEAKLPQGRPFRVWDPTFPDITIELSRRHPQWELTRTNDFMERVDLAVLHGHTVDAVVVTETISMPERNISAPHEQYPEIQSLWMNWKEYFLYQLYKTPGWKPNRYLCQRGRWQAFIYMNAE